MQSEASYRLKLIKKLRLLFPDCRIINNDAASTQGMPDILILFGSRWAMLEIKVSDKASIQPNQEYYVRAFDDMSFASFINPQNEEEVLDALQSALGVGGEARVS